MRISKDRTVIKQEGYVVSCVPYVKPRAMKEELNGLFLAKHGDWLEDREVPRLAPRASPLPSLHPLPRLCFPCSASLVRPPSSPR